MQQLQDLEVREIEVLDKLNSIRILDSLCFGGGTMLRLCHNLNRYSTDMDFWLLSLTKNQDSKLVFTKIKKLLSENYSVIDAYNKRNTILFEFRASDITRSLKIEIRNEIPDYPDKDFKWEKKIAFSKYSTKQVMVKGLTLEQMMKNKVNALLSRKLIRDCFDMEFLLMRGVELSAEKETLKKIIEIINQFKEGDFKVVLGSVLESKDREFYTANKFSLLREEITRLLNRQL